MHGVQWCDGYASDGRTPLPVMLFTGPDAHVRPLGCRVSQEPLSPMDTQQRYGIVCTTPVRTCFDGMRLAPDLEEAVVFRRHDAVRGSGADRRHRVLHRGAAGLAWSATRPLGPCTCGQRREGTLGDKEDAGILVGRATALDFAERAALAERMRRTHRRGRQRDRRVAAWTLSAPSSWGPMGAEEELRDLLLELDP
ncbi:MAG TPA: hypothetical protein VNP20_14715 [Nocardioidaceae bacterium]|nr:hypothetical protein [Nocardioidaceae bacterium]